MSERRRFARRLIRLPCHLALAGGSSLEGHTQDISQEGVFMEAYGLMAQRRNAPKAGQTGMLSLRVRRKGIFETLKVPCRIAHVQSHGMGIHFSSAELTKNQRDLLHFMLDAPSVGA